MIKEGMVVELSYVLTNSEGEELDSAPKESPLAYLHGHSQIIPGLENELVGLKTGDKKQVVIPPELAYGEFDPQLRIKIEKTHFPKDQPLEIGMQFVAEMNDGHQPFVIQKLDETHVYVDGNHPLAGQTLHFDVEVVGVRQATESELEHGHAHGPDGHHHH